MNARGNSLLIEEKERNKVNKTLPKLETELHQLIQGLGHSLNILSYQVNSNNQDALDNDSF
jgi:hypothetical protein